MLDSLRPSPLAGRTFRFTWVSGDGAAVTHEHVFHPDGTVSYAEVHAGCRPEYETARHYGAFQLTDDLCIVSYLGASGFGLTVALDFRRRELHGFARDAVQCDPVQGRFEELSTNAPPAPRRGA